MSQLTETLLETFLRESLMEDEGIVQVRYTACVVGHHFWPSCHLYEATIARAHFIS